ncbi:MAG TPA: hypothetical protein VMN39_06470, partial [Longimicrobiaceae bacterium]|nr:hypothetical protein [Longimicrobiaceae bacterium]
GDLEALEAQTDSLLATASDGAPDSWECAAFNEVFLRRYADARTHLSRYVALAKPEDMPLNLGFLHMRRGDDAEGERILGRAAARARAAAAEDPDSREAHFELAEIAAMRGEVETALEHLEKAVARGLDREWWVFHLFSRDALPDPVFESLYEDPRFERIRMDILSERSQIRRRVVDRRTSIPLADPNDHRRSAEEEARAFMADFEAEIRGGDLDAILGRYSRRGVYLASFGAKTFVPYAELAASYNEGWVAPVSFELDDRARRVERERSAPSEVRGEDGTTLWRLERVR